MTFDPDIFKRSIRDDKRNKVERMDEDAKRILQEAKDERNTKAIERARRFLP